MTVAHNLKIDEETQTKIASNQAAVMAVYKKKYPQGSSSSFGGVDGSVSLCNVRILVYHLIAMKHGVGIDFGSGCGLLSLIICACTDLHMIGFEVRIF